ncbi:MAG TPA: UDP-N-acetylmuramoyl-L-alanyl-D-glutamate--2,6-diaminopimelate ligase, partial [Longimicrobium sp.]|nr:UDP-N-acetylmuramoyl-L-alanyl-D-glutamate--2,6-diaminopimelate ligase [Longimicrobium sp.]
TLGAVRGRLEREGLLAEGNLSADDEARPVAEAWTDSRQVGEGSLFCAYRGTEADSHVYLADVAARGAAGATVERRDESAPLPQIVVTDGRLAASHAAAEVYGDPWNELLLIGLTGTNGKTTSAAILRHLLGRRAPAGSVGTLGAVDQEGKVIPGTEGLTTPGPTEAARWLRQYVALGVKSVAMEVSSHALDQGRMAAARFDAALFTNLTRDHLDYHQTMEAYRAAKLKLLELLKPAGAVVLNADDPAWNGVGASRNRRVVRFSTSAPADVRARDIRVGPGGMEFILSTPSGDTDVALPLFGSFNVSNALGCAAVLWALGWSAGEIAAGLASLPQVPGRLERVSGPPQSATVLIDYAHTPDALERALGALRPLVKGRLWVVFGAGGDRDPGKRPEMGRIASEGADVPVVTSDNPRTEDPEAIIDEIERGMGRAPRRRIPDRREAIQHALLNAGQDDLVLLAGKGHETYQIVGTEKRPFDERQVVREVLAARASQSGGAG